MWKTAIFISFTAELSGVLLLLFGGVFFLLGNSGYPTYLITGIIILIGANIAYFTLLRHRTELNEIAYGLLVWVKLVFNRKPKI